MKRNVSNNLYLQEEPSKQSRHHSGKSSMLPVPCLLLPLHSSTWLLLAFYSLATVLLLLAALQRGQFEEEPQLLDVGEAGLASQISGSKQANHRRDCGAHQPVASQHVLMFHDFTMIIIFAVARSYAILPYLFLLMTRLLLVSI